MSDGWSCSSCLYLDENRTHTKKGFLGDTTYYWCKKFEIWRKSEENRCDAFVRDHVDKACFLTSACVAHRGLSDDCELLTLLRFFRDSYLKNQPHGQELIDEYYQIAPGMVETIDSRADKADIYEFIYQKICICADLIRQEKYQEVTLIYYDMTKHIEQLLA